MTSVSCSSVRETEIYFEVFSILPDEPRPTQEGSLKRIVTFTARISLKSAIKSP